MIYSQGIYMYSENLLERTRFLSLIFFLMKCVDQRMAVLFYGQSFSKSMTNILSKSVFLSVMKMSMQSGIARELDPPSFFILMHYYCSGFQFKFRAPVL